MSSSALQVARTGLSAQDTRMQVIANNLANVSTTAFKRDRTNFSTLAYQDARVAGQLSSAQSQFATGLNLGTGVGVSSTTRIDEQGSLENTGNGLDVAISGNGYYQVLMPNGQTSYTRAGNFSLSAEGQLVNSDGYPIQPAITVPTGATAITIAADGTVSAMLQGQTAATQVGQINTASFANPTALQALGNNLYQETAASGVAQVGVPGTTGRGTLKQGFLESSNVNIVTELVDMIECQRAYEINSKMISSVDEMLKNANQTL
ncbi:flagellar basal-body rod protein FlgG [Novosphingobium sp. FSY-8]|uniref:Flagellar basal-body rod protein FlgG n=1 Tax=Novosphingobium ovatum TaxID=1908523 RepID=A0ABW9XG21_9SPHN|nr:flagellar basal-body rod protein FlgG [Novosphingobium ovatum]NBC37497.1 flagellar basal-body rod protein FlgG [Novosphingobium ovatum]